MEDQDLKEYYYKCKSLAKTGNAASISRLFILYKNAESNQERKDVRKALQTVQNQSIVLSTLRAAILEASDDKPRESLYRLGIFINRQEFMYQYLRSLARRKFITKQNMKEIMHDVPFSDGEQVELVRYMIDTSDYSNVLFTCLNGKFQETIRKEVLSEIKNGVLNRDAFHVLYGFPQYIDLIQDPLRKYILRHKETSGFLLKYLSYYLIENREFLNEWDNLLDVVAALCKEDEYFFKGEEKSDFVRLALKIRREEELSLTDWDIITAEIKKAMGVDHLDSHNGNPVFFFIKTVEALDYEKAEKLYYLLYQKGDVALRKRCLKVFMKKRSRLGYDVLMKELQNGDESSQALAKSYLERYYHNDISPVIKIKVCKFL